MEKKLKILVYTFALLTLVNFLLLTPAYSYVQAVLNPADGEYTAELDLNHIGVSIEVTEDDTVKGIFSQIGTVEPGKKYQEEVYAVNTSDTDEYVRIIVRKSWWDKDGNKTPELDPDLIYLHKDSDKWLLNETESTKERTVYYYAEALEGDSDSDLLFDYLYIDNAIAEKYVVSEPENNVITVTYQYDGYSFKVELEVQSIQTSAVNDAIKSVWGVSNVQVDDDGVLSVK